MAAWLSRTGAHDVALCARRPLPGLTAETPSGTWKVGAAIWSDPAQAKPVDWVLVATKAYDAAGAAAWFPRLRAETDAPVAILQNGIEHRERFAPYLSDDRMVPVIVECPAERPEPTRVRQRRAARLIVSSTGHGPGFKDLFAGTEVEVALADDFNSAAWAKLCLNAAGVISAIVLQPAGIMHDEAVASAAKQIIRECMAVGRAEGAVLADDLPEKIIELYRSQPRDSLNSLHADRLAGRPTELDARNGVIVRLARRHHLTAPCNELAVALIEAQSHGAGLARGSG